MTIPSKTHIVLAFFVSICLHKMSEAITSQDVLTSTGVKAGVISVIGTTDGVLEADIALAGPFMVHGIAFTSTDRDNARKHLLSKGVQGYTIIESYSSLTRLPYSDNFVNVLVIDIDALGSKAPSQTEIDRVLVPNGFLKQKKNGTWTVTQKAWAPGYGNWQHFWGNLTQSGSSSDTVCRVPNSLKWIHGRWDPPPSGSMTTWQSESGFRVDNGKLFYNISDLSVALPSEGNNIRRRSIVGRDAFNGVPFFYFTPGGYDKPARGRFSTVLANDKIYAIANERGFITQYDIYTGKALKVYDKGLQLDNDDFAGLNGQMAECFWVLIDKETMYQVKESTMVALDIATGNVLRSYKDPDGNLGHPTIDTINNDIYMAVLSKGPMPSRWPTIGGVKKIIKVNLSNFSCTWRLDYARNITRLVYYKGSVYGQNSAAILAQEPIRTYVLPDPHSPHAVFKINATTGTFDWRLIFKGAVAQPGEQAVLGSNSSLSMVIWKDIMWLDGNPINLTDGSTVAEKNVRISYNMRCHASRASRDFYATGHVEYYDGRDPKPGQAFPVFSQYATRSQCAQPALPACGQWYFNHSGCRCITNRLIGFLSLSTESPYDSIPDNQRLEDGASYMSGVSFSQPSAMTYNTQNSALKDDLVRTNFAYAKDSLDTSITVGTKLIVPFGREHRIEGRSNGAVDWKFMTGGRISTKPVYANGNVYVACHDGYVYCIDPSNGNLKWRYLAATTHKKIYAYGQLESSWPVFGLVAYNNQVAFSAGRQAELDGGIMIYSLDAATGQLSWKVKVQIENIRISGANTSLSRENHPMTWDGTYLNMNGIKIDPSNPSSYIMKQGVIVKNKKSKLPAHAVVTSTFKVTINQNHVEIITGAFGNQEVELLDTKGRLLTKINGIGPNMYSVPIENISKGSYIAVVNTNGLRQSRSLIIK